MDFPPGFGLSDVRVVLRGAREPKDPSLPVYSGALDPRVRDVVDFELLHQPPHLVLSDVSDRLDEMARGAALWVRDAGDLADLTATLARRLPDDAGSPAAAEWKENLGF